MDYTIFKYLVSTLENIIVQNVDNTNPIVIISDNSIDLDVRSLLQQILRSKFEFINIHSLIYLNVNDILKDEIIQEIISINTPALVFVESIHKVAIKGEESLYKLSSRLDNIPVYGIVPDMQKILDRLENIPEYNAEYIILQDKILGSPSSKSKWFTCTTSIKNCIYFKDVEVGFVVSNIPYLTFSCRLHKGYVYLSDGEEEIKSYTLQDIIQYTDKNLTVIKASKEFNVPNDLYSSFVLVPYNNIFDSMRSICNYKENDLWYKDFFYNTITYIETNNVLFHEGILENIMSMKYPKEDLDLIIYEYEIKKNKEVDYDKNRS